MTSSLSDCRLAGNAVREAGRDQDDNPWPFGSHEYRAWSDGYLRRGIAGYGVRSFIPNLGAVGKALSSEEQLSMKTMKKVSSKKGPSGLKAKTSKAKPATKTANVKAAKADGKAGKLDFLEQVGKGNLDGKANGKTKAAKADGAAKANGNGKSDGVSLSPTFKKVFGALDKAETMTRAELTAVCEKNGAKGWFGRFLKAGIVERPTHGTYKLTAAGRKAISA